MRGIRAVTIGKDKVFDSDEVGDLYPLLLAISHFNDRGLLRAALGNGLLDLDYAQIATICDDRDAWQRGKRLLPCFRMERLFC